MHYKTNNSPVILMLILCFIIVVFPAVSTVKADPVLGIIRITSDGAVEGTDKIQQDGNVYTFTGDLDADGRDSCGLVVERDDVVIDGMGYTFQGNGSGTGIDLSNRTNVTVQNVRIKNFETGITYFHRGGPAVITKNKLFGNTIFNCTIGIHILSEHKIALQNNTMFDNQQSFFLRGVYRFDFNHEVDSSNTVDGKPIYYWINQKNRKVPNDAGTVILVDCKSITLENLQLSNNRVGIYLVFTTYSTINNNLLQNNQYGLSLWGSTDNTINGNTVLENDYGLALNQDNYRNKFQNNSFSDNKINLYLRYSTFDLDYLVTNLIDESNTVNNKPVYYWKYHHDEEVPSNAGYIALINCNRITVKNQNISNNQDGILLVDTAHSIIANNTFTNNFEGITCISSENTMVGNEITNNNASGISIYDGLNNNITGNYIAANGKGVNLKESSDNLLSSNNLTNNSYGVYLYHAPNNTITENQIQDNNVGLVFNAIAYVSTSGNQIIKNNLINNAQQVKLSILIAPTIINSWNNTSEGNYWSSYTGTDNNGDGVGDTPYIIDENNQDNYPLMKPVETKVIPEFPLWIVLPLFLVATLAVVAAKRKLFRSA